MIVKHPNHSRLAEVRLKVIRLITRTLDVHKVRVGRLHKPLELMLPLLVLGRRVEQIDGESLDDKPSMWVYKHGRPAIPW